MGNLRNGWSRSFPTGEGALFPSASAASTSYSLLSFALSSFLSLHPRRRLLLVSTFIAGVILTVIMKREQLLWLLTAAAGARPLLEYQQGTKFDYPGLRFDYDRKFHITMFNDLHLADGGVLPYRPDADDKTIGVMNAVLNSEPNTDLVILNGDLISCEWVAPEDANKHIDKIMQPLLDRQLPWGTTFGNHDYSKTCNVRLMSEHQWDVGNANGRQLTWTTSSVTGDYNQVGSSNYYIPIYDSAGGGNPNLKMIIWLFDSKGGRKYQPQGEDESIADWVDERVRGPTE